MLVFDLSSNSFVIDPHYLSIIPLKAVWESDQDPAKEIATCKLMWLYHMYNPHSPFRDYRQTTKSGDIVKATFPSWYVLAKEKDKDEWMAKAIEKNKQIEAYNKTLEDVDINALSDEELRASNIKRPQKRDLIYIPSVRIYDPAEEDLMIPAIEWYSEYHLKQTPLWNAVSAYDDAMYNLSKIVRDASSTASDIKTASNELDTIPLKRERMRQQAVKDEAQTLKIAGDKQIKRGEKLPNERKKANL